MDSVFEYILSPSLYETYILNMANAAIFLFDLKTGRCSSTIQVRLLCFLEPMNVRWGSELMGVDMFLLDSQSTMMPATVNVNRLAIHMPNLKNYRLSDSSMMIRFSDSTCFDEITEPAIPIGVESFRFASCSVLPTQTLSFQLSNNYHSTDIIGEVTAAKSTVTDPPHDKNRLMTTIKMDNDVSVTMSMFDSQPVKLHNQLESMGGDPRVLVATSINPKIVGGHLFLNATSGTRIYFDKETIAVVAQDTGLAPAAPLLKGYDKVESLSVADLNEFVNSASSQEIDFICTEKVTGIKLDKGWCYVSCSNCTKKLQRTVSLSHVWITDVCSICSHRIYFHWHCIQRLLPHAGDGVNPWDTQAPPFVADMEGKTYKFQVKVSAYNFTENHQIFTISCILSEGDRMPLRQFVVNGGDDDNGDDNSGAISVGVKVETGGSSQVQGSSGIKKKAHKLY
ncbi:hypothetical protein HID58_050884 [Brassica napus]|uniref:Replication factor A C-terminal domain-containing protein n=1 Tax=Brassica napus TaxID=3708 RepID=A0ABQ8A7F8_BRANA|nr:hypothetical protein HID58_050884 [Brassica napus]